jgi:hypothetical protein
VNVFQAWLFSGLVCRLSISAIARSWKIEAKERIDAYFPTTAHQIGFDRALPS